MSDTALIISVIGGFLVFVVAIPVSSFLHHRRILRQWIAEDLARKGRRHG